MFIESFKVESPNVKYTENEIQSVYNYETTELVHENKNGTYQWVVKPKTVKYEFKTDTHVPKLGLESKSAHHLFFATSILIILVYLFICFYVLEWCLWDGEETMVQPSPVVL